jgi:hypothetical protein
MPGQIRITLNRIRTVHGRCKHMMYKWKIHTTSSCDHGNDTQTIIYIATECLIRAIKGTLNDIRTANRDVVDWIRNLDINL